MMTRGNGRREVNYETSEPAKGGYLRDESSGEGKIFVSGVKGRREMICEGSERVKGRKGELKVFVSGVNE
jgi:hypothetical protein